MPFSICRAPAAPGAISRATAFRHARRSTNIFCKFQREGVWNGIWAELHMALRERTGREASPSSAVLDRQSVKSAERAVTTARWVMTPASGSRAAKSTLWSTVKDCRGGASCPQPKSRIATGPAWSSTRSVEAPPDLIWADAGYNAWQVDLAVAKVPRLHLEIVT